LQETSGIAGAAVTAVMPSPAEMEGRLKARIQVADDDLRELRAERAKAVQRHMLAMPGLSGERVYLLEDGKTAAALEAVRRVTMSLN
jgi:hypothetical protein